MKSKNEMIQAVKKANGGKLPDGLDVNDAAQLEAAYSATETSKTNGDDSAPKTDPNGRITNTPMTAADAAKLVKRMVAKTNDKGEIVKDRDNNPVAVPQGIKESEVMSFADYGDRVVVVTTSGEKLEADK